MRREPPTDQPVHRFEYVESVEAECPDCGLIFEGEPDSLESDGVSVICPSCWSWIHIVLDEE